MGFLQTDLAANQEDATKGIKEHVIDIVFIPRVFLAMLCFQSSEGQRERET